MARARDLITINDSDNDDLTKFSVLVFELSVTSAELAMLSILMNETMAQFAIRSVLSRRINIPDRTLSHKPIPNRISVH
jgi:hypothetical protein